MSENQYYVSLSSVCSGTNEVEAIDNFIDRLKEQREVLTSSNKNKNSIYSSIHKDIFKVHSGGVENVSCK